ncbi:MAG: SDR family oxidoreductase [Flavobacteriales bacterium]|nr:SDR family oxidoreductase [Flavobacteriales bacterium]
MDTSLAGQRALVTGSTQGIGRAVAHELASLGCMVVLLARDANTLERVQQSLPRPIGQVHQTLAVDMSDTGALGHALAGSTELLRGTGILVNNTGGPAPGPAHAAPLAAFEQAFRLHLLAYQTLVQAVLPGMQERRQGRIINIISTSVKQPLPNLGVSNTIRGAVANWAKTLANELGPHGITVNNVLPGATETERLADIIRRKAGQTGRTEQEVAEEMRHEVPLRRFAKPEEIAAAVAFLAGPSGAYINGINLPVDGGRTASL